MSAIGDTKSITLPDIRARKGGTPLVCLTANATPITKLVDRHGDIVLVGDSVGMVLHGLPSTLGVTLEMRDHARPGRATRHRAALMVVDMPFGSYEESPEQAFRNAARVMAETGCAAVKLEGGEMMAETILFLAARGVPIMAHIGLTPQAVNTFGGYRVQGRGEDAERIRRDANAVIDAGALAVVLERIPEALARRFTAVIPIPTIGIGASRRRRPDSGGRRHSGTIRRLPPEIRQVLRQFGQVADASIANCAREVRERRFPSVAHVFGDTSLKVREGRTT